MSSERAKLTPLLVTLIVGIIIWFSPVPAGVEIKAWHLLAIFVATIVGIISKPLPMGAVAMLGIMIENSFTHSGPRSGNAKQCGKSSIPH